jgi:cephalosporin-C deacetylase-like acetyl esterase
MQVLNHLSQRLDGANLLRGRVCAVVSQALATGRERRTAARTRPGWEALRQEWLETFYAAFPEELFDRRDWPLNVRPLARYERPGYSIETLLFESLWGWQVNAHLYRPQAGGPQGDGPDENGPCPAVICPTGHSAKTGPSYQIPPVVFARNGLAAITFDAPGQGEKVTGNNHFRQGAACWLAGIWSQTFFVMDALRAIDYLATRPEAFDLSGGVGMTGVSGGGYTTMHAALLDERIRCIAPVCCTGDQGVLGVRDLYTSCPEAFGPGLLNAGLDITEILALAAPLPCLIVGGARDEVYDPAMAREVVKGLRPVYDLYDRAEQLEHFEQQDAGHEYSPQMAERVALWMHRWLQPEASRSGAGASPLTEPILSLTEPQSVLEPAELLHCAPAPHPTMQSIAGEKARLSAKARHRPGPGNYQQGGAQDLQEGGPADGAWVDKLRATLAVGQPASPEVQVAPAETAWRHRVERLALQTEPHLWVPALFVQNLDAAGPAPTLLWIDEKGKWDALQNELWLRDALGFLSDSSTLPWHVFAVDVRGWGETAPEHVAYDMASWNDIMRILSYLSIGVGQPLLGRRVHDVLAGLEYLSGREDLVRSRIVVGGRGIGALVALLAACLDERIAGLLSLEMLASFVLLFEEGHYQWTHDLMVPGLLEVADIPDLIRGLACPTLVVNPLDARRRPLSEWTWEAGKDTTLALNSSVLEQDVGPWLQRLSGECL